MGWGQAGPPSHSPAQAGKLQTTQSLGKQHMWEVYTRQPASQPYVPGNKTNVSMLACVNRHALNTQAHTHTHPWQQLHLQPLQQLPPLACTVAVVLPQEICIVQQAGANTAGREVAAGAAATAAGSLPGGCFHCCLHASQDLSGTLGEASHTLHSNPACTGAISCNCSIARLPNSSHAVSNWAGTYNCAGMCAWHGMLKLARPHQVICEVLSCLPVYALVQSSKFRLHLAYWAARAAAVIALASDLLQAASAACCCCAPGLQQPRNPSLHAQRCISQLAIRSGDACMQATHQHGGYTVSRRLCRLAGCAMSMNQSHPHTHWTQSSLLLYCCTVSFCCGVSCILSAKQRSALCAWV